MDVGAMDGCAVLQCERQWKGLKVQGNTRGKGRLGEQGGVDAHPVH